jgi:hypothetical protein
MQPTAAAWLRCLVIDLPAVSAPLALQLYSLVSAVWLHFFTFPSRSARIRDRSVPKASLISTFFGCRLPAPKVMLSDTARSQSTWICYSKRVSIHTTTCPSEAVATNLSGSKVHSIVTTNPGAFNFRTGGGKQWQFEVNNTLYPRWIIVIRVVSRCGCLTMSLPHQVCWNCWYADSLTFIISQPAGDYLHVPWLGQPTSMHHCTSMLSP